MLLVPKGASSSTFSSVGSSAPSPSLAERAGKGQFICSLFPDVNPRPVPDASRKRHKGIDRERLGAGELDGAVKRFFADSCGREILTAPPAPGLGSLARAALPLMTAVATAAMVLAVVRMRVRDSGQRADEDGQHLDRARRKLNPTIDPRKMWPREGLD